MQVHTISRDPFGRFDNIRTTIPKDDRRKCRWCGRPAKYHYGTHEDGINKRPYLNPNQYCSVGCYRTHNG